MNTSLAVIDPATGEIVTAPSQGGVLQLADRLESIVAAFQGYQRACEALLTPDDYQNIGGKQLKKKSAFRKLATAFNVTTTIVQRHVEYDDLGRIHHAEFVVRATAPNGRSAEAWGGASVTERDFSHDQDVAATAQTRATSRAIADLIGAGEVSAEEVDGQRQQGPRQAGAAPLGTCPMGHPMKKRSGKYGDFLKCTGKLDDGKWHDWTPPAEPEPMTPGAFWNEWAGSGRTVLQVVDALGLSRDDFDGPDDVKAALAEYIATGGTYEDLLKWQPEAAS